jgi:NarL family two-component system response regulator LiaR
MKGATMIEKNPSESSSQDRIRVLIVDDHSLVRSGLQYFLLAFDDLELVGEASSGQEALEMCAQVQPDVVLMDLMMPGMDGATATCAICERWPHVRVIVLTNFQDVEMVRGALQAGATGYLLKNVRAHDLADAIRAAHAGQPTLAPEATQALIDTVTHSSTLGHDLTSREWEVLSLMVEGQSNAEIAERLVIGLSTVKFHVSNILSKLGVTSCAEAVALAMQHRLTPRPGKN